MASKSVFTLSGGHPVSNVLSLDEANIVHPITFCYLGGVAADSADFDIYESSGQNAEVLIPKNAHIIAATLTCQDVRSAGTLTVEPAVNGTKIVATGLDLVLDGTTTNNDSVTVAIAADYAITAGQRLGCKGTTVGFAPNNKGIRVDYYLTFDA